jgi:hypothetical protein
MDDPKRDMAAVLVGGAGGAILVSTMIRTGLAPRPAALAVAVGGGLGALALRGTMRRLAIGAAAASVGQLALMWMEARAAAEAQRSGELAEAFSRARREMARDRAMAASEDERRAVVIDLSAPVHVVEENDDVEEHVKDRVVASETEERGCACKATLRCGDQDQRPSPEVAGMDDPTDKHAAISAVPPAGGP